MSMYISRNPDYKVNTLLLRLIQPYSEEDLESLKQELIELPDLRVVRVWNGYHLDDMEKYKICEQCRLDYIVEETNFPDLTHAAIYVCKNQLKRSDLSSEYIRFLIGQRYNYEKKAASNANNSPTRHEIITSIASELFLSEVTIRKYCIYANAINEIFDQDNAFAINILTGKARISHDNTIELARLSPDEIRSIGKNSIDENKQHITLSYIRSEVKWSHTKPGNKVTRRERFEARASNKAKIHQMPKYDPDSEVNSLCFTMDSWISSMQRVKNSENFPKITSIACLRLMNKLTALENTIKNIQDSLVERSNYEG